MRLPGISVYAGEDGGVFFRNETDKKGVLLYVDEDLSFYFCFEARLVPKQGVWLNVPAYPVFWATEKELELDSAYYIVDGSYRIAAELGRELDR